MCMDRKTVYRRAMQCLGQAEYVEHAPTQDPCDIAFTPALLEACSRYNWSFTLRHAKLERVASEAHEVFGKALYKLPTDCVTVTAWKRADGLKVSWPELCADGVLVPLGECAEGLYIEYHCDLMGDLGLLSDPRCALFVEGVVRLLASKVCMPITSNHNLAAQLKAEADDYFYRAIHQDAQQHWSNDKSPRAILRNLSRNR